MNEVQRIVELAFVRGSTNFNVKHTAIEITDPTSHALIRIELDMETLLGSLLHGGRDHKVRATFRNAEHWGKKLIRKSIRVYLKKPLPYDTRDAFVAKLGARYETDGWIFAGPQQSWSKDDHGWNGKREYVRLHFKKYVAVKSKQVTA